MLLVEGMKISFVALLTNLSTLLHQIILEARDPVIEVSGSW